MVLRGLLRVQTEHLPQVRRVAVVVGVVAVGEVLRRRRGVRIFEHLLDGVLAVAVVVVEGALDLRLLARGADVRLGRLVRICGRGLVALPPFVEGRLVGDERQVQGHGRRLDLDAVAGRVDGLGRRRRVERRDGEVPPQLLELVGPQLLGVEALLGLVFGPGVRRRVRNVVREDAARPELLLPFHLPRAVLRRVHRDSGALAARRAERLEHHQQVLRAAVLPLLVRDGEPRGLDAPLDGVVRRRQVRVPGAHLDLLQLVALVARRRVVGRRRRTIIVLAAHLRVELGPPRALRGRQAVVELVERRQALGLRVLVDLAAALVDLALRESEALVVQRALEARVDLQLALLAAASERRVRRRVREALVVFEAVLLLRGHGFLDLLVGLFL